VSDVKQVGDDFSFIGISAPMSKATAEEAQVYKRVVEDLTQAIKLDMSTGQIYTERGYAYSRMGNLNSAMADFDQGIRLDPTPWAFNVRGVDYMHRGDYDRAIADFNSAVRISPDYDSGWFNLSTALKGRSISHFENGNIDSAIADFEQSLGILTNENDKQFLAFMLNRRALEYAYNGDLDRAVTDLEAAFQHDPNNADIRRGLEVIRQQRGR
jgi:tetratricopeptide (TPR) repeat protein